MSSASENKRGLVAVAIFIATTGARLLAGLAVVKIIANSTGAEGFGILGQFMSVLSIVAAFAGGGMTTGVVKYVAEKKLGEGLTQYLDTALALAIWVGILSCIVLAIFADLLSELLFGTAAYSTIFYWLALAQFTVGLNNFFMGIINGHRDAVGFSVATIAGSLCGVGLLILTIKRGDIDSAMLGLLYFTIVTVVFSGFWLWLKYRRLLFGLRPRISKGALHDLVKYSGLKLLSAFSLPLAHIEIRSIAAEQFGWAVVGYWQGVNKVSDAYLQFFTIFLANYFMPRIVETHDIHAIKKLIYQGLKVSMLACMALSILIYIFRDGLIALLFSQEFAPMSDYFAFQLAGDVMKIGAYTLIYVAIAKAMFRVWIFAEIAQASLLVLFTWLGGLYFGPKGMIGGYALTYALYFFVSLGLFSLWVNREQHRRHLV